MKAWTLIVTVIALTVAAGSTDAAAKRKHKRVYQPAPVASMSAPTYTGRTPGPIWAGPGECYTDEGYGRYTACGAGRGGE